MCNRVMATKIPNFRLFLHKISDELVTDELESLKFLCRDILTKARLEKITNAREFFVAIGEVVGGGEDKQLDFIKELLAAIKRLDLAVQVEEFQSKRTGLVHNNSVQKPLQPNPSHSVFPDNQDEAPAFQSGSSVWPSQRPSLPSLAASYQVTGNLPQGPVKLTGNASLYCNSGIQQARDLVQNLLRNNNPTAQPGSGVRSPEAHQPSRFSTTDSQPSYQVQNSSSGSEVNPAAHIHPAGLNRNPEEHFKPSKEQESTWKYQSQYSVPYGQQEQSSEVNKDEENRQWKDDKIEVVNLPDLLQSAPQWEEQKLQSAIQEVNLSDHPQSSPVMENPGEDRAGHDKITPENSSDLLQFSSNRSTTAMETSGEVSGDLSQGNISANSQGSKENLDNTDHSRGRVRSWTDGGSPATASTSSDRHHRISQPGANKCPVERLMSHNCDVEQAQHLNHKCPVEMNYECISTYFNSGGKNLGQGGFGTVYEGTCTFHDQSVVVKEEHSYHLGQAYSAAQLQREKRVGYIKHPHLMPLYAFCEEKGKPRCLMYPKMHNDLHKALRKDLTGHTKLPWENRVRIALHTARALLYLHTEVTNERNVRQEIVHMDVKPGNIFLDEDFNARLGDPGMAQELPMEHSYASISQIRGTEGYMDEYQRDRHFKPVNDIFSYGVVLLQLLTQRKAMVRKPLNKNAPLCRVLKEEGVLADPEQLMEKAQKGVWPDSEGDEQYTKEFAAIAIDCLKPPDERAKLSDVCQRLEEILERKGFSKASKPKEGAGCVSCLLNSPAKHLGVRSTGCDRNITEECNYFCARCLSQARRNPLECPSHGPAEPPIGRSNIYAVLVCGNDPNSPKATAVFERDLLGFKSVLTDSRIVGVRCDHIYTITPLSSCGMSQADLVRQALHELKDKLQGKKDVFLYFYFSGHSDQSGNLLCSSDTDLLTEADLKEHFKHLNVDEILIILDCCFADGKIASEHIGDESFLVHKSPLTATETELQPHPLASLCSNLQDTAADENSTVPTGEPSSNATEELPNTGFDVLDGNVFNKAPLVSFTVRQWSSSLSQQLSYAKAKGSFLTQYIICGLRGAHECPFSNCSSCDTFRTKAKSLGYIAAGDLENFFSTHVEKAALAAGGFHQNPRIRTVRSRETKLAFYNDKILRDEIIFKSFTSGLNERIIIDKFPFSLLQFQQLVFSKVQGHLPTCAQPKHLQILCDDQEMDATSYVDLQEFLRQGYDVRCQLRPCSGVVYGPVVVQIQNYKDQVITLLTSLGLTRNQQEDLDTFEMDTSRISCTAEDVRECCDDQPSLSELKDTQVARSIVLILTEASLYIGCLTICVSDDSLDCCFTKALN